MIDPERDTEESALYWVDYYRPETSVGRELGYEYSTTAILHLNRRVSDNVFEMYVRKIQKSQGLFRPKQSVYSIWLGGMVWPDDLLMEAREAHFNAHSKAPLVAGNLALGNSALDQKMLMHPWPTKGYYEFTVRYFIPDTEPDYDLSAEAYLVASIHLPAGLSNRPILVEVRRFEGDRFNLYVGDELTECYETLSSALLGSLAVVYAHARSRFDRLNLRS